MTSGRDEAKKRRGRGKAEEGPSDEDLGWLAELRSARGDGDVLQPPPATPGARPGGGRRARPRRA